VAGVSISDKTAANALKTSGIASAMDPVASDGGNVSAVRSMSIEMWFTVDGSIASTADYVLLEIGDGSATSLGMGLNDFHLRIFYKRNAFDSLCISFIAQRGEPAVNDLKNAVQDSSTFIGGLSTAAVTDMRTNPGSKVFQMMVTIESSGQLTFYVNQLGNNGLAVSSVGMSAVRKFGMLSTSVMRVMTTATPTGSVSGFPGTMRILALYNRALTQTEVLNLFNGGAQNSLPAVRSNTFVVTEDLATMVNLNQSGIVTYDDDGNTVSGFLIKTLPGKGTLFYDGVPISSAGYPVPDISRLTYKADPNDFTSSNGVCSSTYTSFDFTATDGLCDRSGTLLTALNCNSPVAATASICVVEANDPPIVVNNGEGFNTFTNTNKPSAITLTCKDPDTNTTVFGLKKIRVKSQTRSDLGTIYFRTDGNGLCSAGTLLTVINNNVVNVSPASNTQASASFCYQSAVANVGTDIIGFECEDASGATTTGSVSITVQSPLQVDCGGGCTLSGSEDIRFKVVLNGTDLDGSHDRLLTSYKITALPARGTFYRLGTNTPIGLNEEILQNSDGSLTVEFQAPTDYYNALCATSTPPAVDQATGLALCDRTPDKYTFGDYFGVKFNACPTQGCPLSFSYKMLYKFGSIDLESGIGSVTLWILGRQDNDGVLSGPPTLRVDAGLLKTTSFKTADKRIRFSTLKNNTFRVGFHISIDVKDKKLCLRFPDALYEAFAAAGTRNRITFMTSESSDLCDSPILSGKAYPTDLNNLFDVLEVKRPEKPLYRSDTAKIQIKVYNPVTFPAVEEPGVADFDPSDFDDGSTYSSEIIVVWAEELPEFSDPQQYAIVLGSTIMGVFFLFIFIIFLIWFYISLQPEPVPVKEEEDDAAAIALAQAEAQYSAQNDLDALDRVTPTSGGVKLRQMSDRKRPLSASEKALFTSSSRKTMTAPEEEDEKVDLSILEWEKFVDPTHNKPYFFNHKTGESTWYPPIPGRAKIVPLSGSSSALAPTTKAVGEEYK